MPFLPDLWEKVKNCFAAFAGFFKGLAGKLSGPGFLGKLSHFPGEYGEKLLGKIPEKKRKMVLICGGGGLVLLVFAGALMMNSSKEPRPGPTRENNQIRRMVIPPEEIFLPDEPDFVPGVLLERERRTDWTVLDAASFWQDPLKNGEERWRERVEAVIDEFLERVP